MKRHRILVLLLIVVLALTACGKSQPPVDTNAIYTSAAQTMQAQVPTATETPVPGNEAAPMGTLSGRVANPLTDGVFSILVVAFDTSKMPVIGDWYYQKLEPNQEYYSIGAPAGMYYVVAYILNENSTLATVGGYTAAIPCGLGTNCTDHRLVAVPVESGRETPNINPDDFNGPMDQYPPVPGSGEIPGEAGLPPMTTPVSAASGALTSLSDCAAIRDNAARAIPFRWTMIDEPYTDPISGRKGMVCHIEADGTGVDFGALGVGGIITTIESTLTGWTTDNSRGAAGPSALQLGYARGSATLVVSVVMRPSADANCPTDQPIASCTMTPEQQIYTIIIRGWQ
jgi:hypothetical protein